MNWNWLTDFFTAPGRVREQAQQLVVKNILLKENRDQLVACQTDRSKMFTDLTWAIKEKKSLSESLTALANESAYKDVEIQALKDLWKTDYVSFISETIIAKDKLIKELQATALRRQGTIENLTQQRDEARDITPESLTSSLKAKYPQGNPEAWDKLDLALINAFALANDGEFKILTQAEFVTALYTAFPDAKFMSEPLDNAYYAPSMDFAEKAVRNDFGNLRPFGVDINDCDDFAEDLRVHFRQVYGYNTGVIVLGDAPIGYHAWILIVCFNGIVMVEPQADSMTRIPVILDGYIVRKFHTY